jgi:hypothetical protein
MLDGEMLIVTIGEGVPEEPPPHALKNKRRIIPMAGKPTRLIRPSAWCSRDYGVLSASSAS